MCEFVCDHTGPLNAHATKDSMKHQQYTMLIASPVNLSLQFLLRPPSVLTRL